MLRKTQHPETNNALKKSTRDEQQQEQQHQPSYTTKTTYSKPLKTA
jgi:hypothetical protein